MKTGCPIQSLRYVYPGLLPYVARFFIPIPIPIHSASLLQSPADFLLEIHSPQAILTRLSRLPQQSAIDDASITTPHLSRTGLSTTRLKYARIRVVDTGIRTPTRTPDLPVSAARPISFILVLEQLYLGVIPASLVPAACFLIPVLACAALATPWILGYLDHFIKEARQELRDFSTVEEKKEH